MGESNNTQKDPGETPVSDQINQETENVQRENEPIAKNNEREKQRFRFERKGLYFPLESTKESIVWPVVWLALAVAVIIAYNLTPLLNSSDFFFPEGGQWPILYKQVFVAFLPILFSLIAFKFKSDQLKDLFRPFKAKDIPLIIILVILSLVVTLALAKLVPLLTGGAAASAVLPSVGESSDSLSQLSASGGALRNPAFDEFIYPLFWITFPIQMLGEELLKICTFLAVFLLIFIAAGKGVKHRKLAIVVALVVSCFIFGICHLPAYGWDLTHVLFVIGLSSIIDMYAWVKTKNIWVTFAVHLIFDFLLFLPGIFGLIVL